MTLQDAQTLIRVAQEHATAIGARVAVAVVDSGGHVMSLARMDGAPPLSARIAETKAASCVLLGRDGASLQAMQEAWPSFFAQASRAAGRPLLVGAGALIVRDAGTAPYALAVSGGQPDQDDACAQAAIAALGR